MSELEQEYAGQAEFVIVSPEDTANSQDDIEKFGFTQFKHGLVIFDGEGEPKTLLPGHQFGRAEIEAGLVALLE